MRLISTLLSLLCFLSIVAQEQQRLDTITISSTQLPQKLHESGRDVVVLDSEEIEAIPVESVSQILRYLPGVEVKNRGPFGVQSDITIRGATFSQVLVLIDGIRVNDPLTAHFNGYLPVSKNEIKRIEVLKGPAAAMFGADAMGGVINIVTKTGDYSYRGEQFNGSATMMAGENSLFAAQGAANFSKKGWKASVGMNMSESRGHRIDSTTRGFFDMKSVSGGLSKRWGRWQVYARTGLDYRDFSAQNFYTLSTFDESEETVRNWWNLTRLSHVTGDSKTSFSFSYKQNQDTFLFNPAFPANTHLTQQFIVQADHYKIINEKVKWQVGLQGTRRTIESTDRGDHEVNHGGAYGMLQWTPTSNFSISTSGRVDADQNYGIELTPQISLSYWEENFRLRASGGRSIRAADFTERYISTEIPGPLTSGRNLGNAELNAESAWSGEAGFDLYPTDFLSFSASGFYRLASDVIDYVITSGSQIETSDNVDPTAEYFYATNIAQVTTYGVDGNIGISHEYDGGAVRGNVGVMWLRINTEEPVVSKYITNQASFLVTTNLDWQNEYFSIGVTGLYKKRPAGTAEALGIDLDESYMVWNGDLSVNLYKNRLHATGRIMNILDVDYADILGARMPGRWIMGGLKFKF